MSSGLGKRPVDPLKVLPGLGVEDKKGMTNCSNIWPMTSQLKCQKDARSSESKDDLRRRGALLNGLQLLLHVGDVIVAFLEVKGLAAATNAHYKPQEC